MAGSSSTSSKVGMARRIAQPWRTLACMNYHHAFHAGNHADVLKHVALLALCDALRAKPAACFALDTHAGRGWYSLDAEAAQRTGEAAGGVPRLASTRDSASARYFAAVAVWRA